MLLFLTPYVSIFSHRMPFVTLSVKLSMGFRKEMGVVELFYKELGTYISVCSDGVSDEAVDVLCQHWTGNVSTMAVRLPSKMFPRYSSYYTLNVSSDCIQSGWPLDQCIYDTMYCWTSDVVAVMCYNEISPNGNWLLIHYRDYLSHEFYHVA